MTRVVEAMIESCTERSSGTDLLIDNHAAVILRRPTVVAVNTLKQTADPPLNLTRLDYDLAPNCDFHNVGSGHPTRSWTHVLAVGHTLTVAWQEDWGFRIGVIVQMSAFGI
jgi:hypothetical protein